MSSSLKVIVKYGKGYDAPWVTFDGDTAEEIMEQMDKFFGPDTSEGADKLTPHERMLKVQDLVLGSSAMSKGTGAKPMPQRSKGKGKAFDQAESKSNEPDADPYEDVINAMKGAERLSDLKTLWARHQEAYNDSEAVRAAYKARGKELKAAEKSEEKPAKSEET